MTVVSLQYWSEIFVRVINFRQQNLFSDLSMSISIFNSDWSLNKAFRIGTSPDIFIHLYLKSSENYWSHFRLFNNNRKQNFFSWFWYFPPSKIYPLPNLILTRGSIMFNFEENIFLVLSLWHLFHLMKALSSWKHNSSPSLVLFSLSNQNLTPSG